MPQRKRLSELTELFRQGLNNLNHDCLGTTYIIPLLIPGNDKVVRLANKLQNAGILAMPIRSPTVRSGGERIRFSLTANLPEEVIQQCLETLHEV